MEAEGRRRDSKGSSWSPAASPRARGRPSGQVPAAFPGTARAGGHQPRGLLQKRSRSSTCRDLPSRSGARSTMATPAQSTKPSTRQPQPPCASPHLQQAVAAVSSQSCPHSYLHVSCADTSSSSVPGPSSEAMHLKQDSTINIA